MSNKFISEVHPIENNVVIGAKNAGKTTRWQMRYYCPIGKKNHYKQLGLLYEEGSRSNYNEAVSKARAIYKDLIKAANATGDPLAFKSLHILIREFLEDVEAKALINEERIAQGFEPLHYIPKGTGDSYWRKTTLDYYKPIFRDSLIPYFEAKSIYKINALDIELWKVEDYTQYVNETAPEKSPTYISYGIAAIRQVFGFAYRYTNKNGIRTPLVKGIPTPDRPKRRIKQRARRNLKREEYNKILDGVNKRCEDLKRKYLDKRTPFYKDKYDRYYQFWLFLRIITWCGYRPYGGDVEHTILRMDDFKIEVIGDKEQRFIKRKEKNKEYLAPLLPEAWVYHDALIEFHRKNGNVYNHDAGEWSLTPYAFFHTGRYEGRYNRGDKIKTFRELWNKVIDAQKIKNIKGAPASERLVPYSLRGYFITMRLRHSDVDIGKLSKSVGTSTRMIEQTYYDFIASSEWDSLTKTDVDAESRRKLVIDYV